jgi:hypothetical protein
MAVRTFKMDASLTHLKKIWNCYLLYMPSNWGEKYTLANIDFMISNYTYEV